MKRNDKDTSALGMARWRSLVSDGWKKYNKKKDIEIYNDGDGIHKSKEVRSMKLLMKSSGGRPFIYQSRYNLHGRATAIRF